LGDRSPYGASQLIVLTAFGVFFRRVVVRDTFFLKHLCVILVVAVVVATMVTMLAAMFADCDGYEGWRSIHDS
jgi:hypothetical protein